MNDDFPSIYTMLAYCIPNQGLPSIYSHALPCKCRLDGVGLFECFKFSYHQFRIAPFENSEEFEVTDIGGLQGDSK